MNVLFLNVTDTWFPKPNSERFSLSDTTYPPLGMLYMGSVLEQAGHRVEILDFQFEKNPFDEIRKRINSIDIIGMNVDNFCRYRQQQVATAIRRIDSSIPLVIGGPFCTLREEYSLKFIPEADFCVVGEGEYALLQILDALSRDSKFSKIPGVIYRSNHTIKTGKPAEVINDLDALPFPARHLVKKYDYGRIGKTHLHRPKVTSILTSRGCNARCRFCVRHILQRFRQRSAQNVVDELVEIDEDYGSVMIVDDNFLIDRKRAHAIMDLLINHGTSIDLLIAGTRVDTAEKTLFEKMKKAGLKHIQFGLESGVQQVLDYYRKGTTLEQARKAVALAREQRFFITGSFILGAPMETLDDMMKTVEFACSLPLDIAIFTPLHFYHGSDIWNEAVSAGAISEDEQVVLSDSRRNIGVLTTEELLTFCSTALKQFYLRPSYLAREVLKALVTHNFGIIKAWLNYL